MGVFARPQKGTRQHQQWSQKYDLLWADPVVRERTRSMYQRAWATIAAQLDSGAGYPSDKMLREFLGEYNFRESQHGSSYMPASFEIAEAFFHRTSEFAGFLIFPESDYLISYADFLDYITTPGAPPLDIGATAALPPNLIVNVNSLDEPGELMLEADNGHAFSISGASYIRRGDEVVMLIVAGEKLPPDDLKELAEAAKETITPPKHKSDLDLSDKTRRQIVFIDDAKELVRVIALCRFNLKEQLITARLLLRDLGNGYAALTDIAGVLSPLFNADEKAVAQEKAAEQGRELDEVSVIWDAAKMLLLLPAYLNARITLKRTEQRTTALAIQAKNSLKRRMGLDKALPEAKILFRKISAIRVETPATTQHLAGRHYTPPMFQVPVEGYWRYYEDVTTQGHDEKGESVLGKTWVKSHIRHREKAEGPGPKVVYIKASLSLARRKLAQYRTGFPPPTPPTPPVSSQVANESAEALRGAFVYVFRCPAHGSDIFKVGYTDRDPEQRARELSKKTATPTPFLVVQAWAVSEGKPAEAAAHQALDAYRLDAKREFFCGTYALIRQALEEAIAPWVIA